MHRTLAVVLCLAAAACHNRNGAASAPPAPLILAAGMETLAPADASQPMPEIDTARLSLAGVDRNYRFTTPGGVPFRFEVACQSADNTGTTRVSVAHAKDGNATPTSGIESLARAGCVPTANSIVTRDTWLDAYGDGFVRMTISGTITETQVLVLEGANPSGSSTGLVEIAIGPTSSINRNDSTAANDPGLLSTTTLYSSDSWLFGQPTVAVSGDRTSVVTYEGDRANHESPRRFELRLQHENATGTVRGGGSDETGSDSGHWRDHEIAALFNVLAIVRCTNDQLAVGLSFDRGATFGQQVGIVAGVTSLHLAQIAIAADYTLAVTYWQNTFTSSGASLMLTQGQPVSFDAYGSPTWYQFSLPVSVHHADGMVSPVLMGNEYSSGGDLVLAYGYSTFTQQLDGTFVVITRTGCAVRPHDGTPTDRILDEEVMLSRDPSVAVLGRDQTLRIFCAYESRDGIRLRTSDDAGATFSPVIHVAWPGAHTPSVFARQVGTATRLDVLYLDETAQGTELHRCRWLDFPTSTPEDFRLTTARLEPTATAPGQRIGLPTYGPLDFGYRITQVAWLGYDATLDGDQLVIAVDEESFDSAFLCLGGRRMFGSSGGLMFPNAAQFNPALPPPLAPGMQLPLPAPDATQRHQLKLLRVE